MSCINDVIYISAVSTQICVPFCKERKGCNQIRVVLKQIDVYFLNDCEKSL